MVMNNFAFNVLHEDRASGARLAQIVTPHGTLNTPNFIFCATKAAIKGLSVAAMQRAGTDIILANTYHLMLQPGAALVEGQGGLHHFTQWPGPMLTDSGGYQVFSMAWGGFADEIKGRSKVSRRCTVKQITQEGVAFQSYIDGATHWLTPEKSMLLQRQLGADLIMAFDECTAFHHGYDYTAASLERSHHWATRSLNAFEAGNKDNKQALYGIIQGSFYRDLREKGAAFVTSLPFFGTAVGGCLGKTKQELYDIVGWLTPWLKRNRPVHLLGIGDIADVFAGVRRGIDTFDCVQPTRLARHGVALMPHEATGRINLRNARFREDKTPLDPENHHPHTASYSRAYLHHLIKAGESLAGQILAEHNVSVMNRLMREIRAGIGNGTLDAVEQRWLNTLPEAEREHVFGDPRG